MFFDLSTDYFYCIIQPVRKNVDFLEERVHGVKPELEELIGVCLQYRVVRQV